MIDKIRVFEDELSFIENEEIRAFTEKCIKRTPDYFYEVAASSTGFHHPDYAITTGGLIRHTKAVVLFAHELLSLEQYRQQFTPEERDCIIAACILHDSFKYGKVKNEYTIVEHPLVAAQFVYEMREQEGNFVGIIADAIASHMGEFNTDYKTKEKILPKPVTDVQKFVHMCDFLASRKKIDIRFDNFYFPKEYVIEPVCVLSTDVVEEINDLCKQLIVDNKACREDLIQLIAGENNGDGNLKKINTTAEAEKILNMIKERYYGSQKEISV